MVSINEQWWLHLTPKAMHGRRREFEAHLRNWVKTDYGAFWLASALRPGGLIRVKPDQAIPAFHAIKLADRPMFIAPQESIQAGHRGVGLSDMASGRPLANNEIAITPLVRLDLADDPVLLNLARTGKAPKHVSGVTRPSQIFSIPAHYLLTPTMWPKKTFVLYQHIFGEGGSYPNEGLFYVGLTTRSWQTRWSEHRRAMRNGSKLLFHRTFREETEAGRITYVHHQIMGITQDLDALYDAEEALVAGHWNDQRRLNMIPGGKQGFRYLRKVGAISQGPLPTPDERELIINAWAARDPTI